MRIPGVLCDFAHIMYGYFTAISYLLHPIFMLLLSVFYYTYQYFIDHDNDLEKLSDTIEFVGGFIAGAITLLYLKLSNII